MGIGRRIVSRGGEFVNHLGIVEGVMITDFGIQAIFHNLFFGMMCPMAFETRMGAEIFLDGQPLIPLSTHKYKVRPSHPLAQHPG